jgi:predicted DNA-binding transcriptional regulator YafY
MKTDRLMSMLMVLLNHELISAARLAEMFEVSARTIYRDAETLSMAGIPIVTYPGVNGGIGVMPEFKVDKKLFTASDVSKLLMGLRSITPTLTQRELQDTLEKLKSLIPKEHHKELEMRSSQIRIDLAPWTGNKNFEPNFEKIKRALYESRLVGFQYFNGNRTKSDRRVEPYQMILKAGQWYLLGYCMLREDFRLFKLSRIANLEVLDTTFVAREYEDKPLDGTGWIDQRLITIRLLIDESLREQIIDRCGEENMEPFGSEKFLVNFPFAEDDMGYNTLLGFGEKCECLSPEHVRKELARRIHKLAAIYNKT